MLKIIEMCHEIEATIQSEKGIHILTHNILLEDAGISSLWFRNNSELFRTLKTQGNKMML